MGTRPVRSLLLVEDNAGDARLLREMIFESGTHEVSLVHVGSMSEAEEHLRLQPADFILLDLGLPDAQGLDVVRRARAAAPGAPLVVLTGYDDDALASQAMKEGAQDYLIKGQIEPRGLMRALRYAADRSTMEKAQEAGATARGLLEDQLRQAQKMEAIGQLAGGVAHDFNNVLTVILGHASMLEDRLPKPSNNHESAVQIRQAAVRAAAMTRQLLAFSRRQVIEPRILDLNAIVENLKKMLRRMIGDNIMLVTTPTPGIGRVRADPGQIEQVLMNLAVNARDAMPDGGTLTISLRDVAAGEPGMEQLRSKCPGPVVVLTVSDSGCGMTPEVASRIFEPFFTTKGVGKGTGLGLATVYGIVQQSGGELRVESAPGAGTSFEICLPRVEGEVAEDLERVQDAAAWSTGTVLVVEDEPAARLLTRTILESGGYTVLEAPGGKQALELAKAQTGIIDLLLTDVVLPGMGGPELVEHMTAARPRIKVLLMSGYTNNTELNESILARKIEFLQKPFTPQDLLLKVREVLG